MNLFPDTESINISTEGSLKLHSSKYAAKP